MQELVLGPLGQQATYDPRVALWRAHATGYGMDGGEIVEVTPQLLPRHSDPAGGLWTDVRDQIRYAQFHLGQAVGHGSAPLDRSAIAEMQTSLMTMPEAKLDVGWSWWREQAGAVRLLRHNGDTFGQMASLVLAPDRGFAFTILLNSTAAQGVRVLAEKEAFKQYLGVGPAENTYEASQMTAMQLKEYEGSYAVPTTAAQLSVKGGTLMFKHELSAWPGQIQPSIPLQLPELPLAFVDADYAVLGSAEQPVLPVSFLRKADGSIGWLSVADRVFPRI
jgi:hypothetical protein